LEDDESIIDEFREPTRRDRRIKDSDYFSAWEGVFDAKTLEAIEYLKRKRIIEDIYWVVSTGKEADVFYAKSPKGEEYAVKIYRIHTSRFKRKDIYVLGDRRFARGLSEIKEKWSWARREFKSLKIAWRYEIHVPRPITVYRNVVVMEFIGEDGTPAPLLKDVEEIEEPEKVFKVLIEDINKLYNKAKLVHADLSPFNILYHKGICWIIDMAQAVRTSHHYALQFLYRDLYHLRNFFAAFIDELPTADELFKMITGREPDLIIKSYVEG